MAPHSAESPLYLAYTSWIATAAFTQIAVAQWFMLKMQLKNVEWIMRTYRRINRA
jgi:hypothetical protein